MLKVLFWDRSGFWLWQKRLEGGTFRVVWSEARALELEAPELALILEGIELRGARRRRRYRRPHRKKVKTYNEPGHAHLWTFSCCRRLPLLTNDLWRTWLRRDLDAALGVSCPRDCSSPVKAPAAHDERHAI